MPANNIPHFDEPFKLPITFGM